MGGDPLPHKYINPPDPPGDSNEPSQPPNDGIHSLALPCDTIPLEVQDADRALGADNVPGTSENLTESTMEIDRVDTFTNATKSQNINSHDRIYEQSTVNISGVVSKRVREANTYAQHRKSIQPGDNETMAERTRIFIPGEISAPNNAD